MAQGFLTSLLPSTSVSSAGLSALRGYPADPHAIEAMADLNVDISQHRATQLVVGRVQESELILVMTTDQKKRIERAYPFSRGRVFRLGEFENLEIKDPYKMDLDVFIKSRDEIRRGVEQWVKKIVSV
jgi:protein-tyrosine phosphatase